ncbi:hypothetical protein Hanom_Chr05g00454131 [Helianthus anomalus]
MEIRRHCGTVMESDLLYGYGLTDLFVEDGDRDDDLLIHGTVMQWLHLFDMQVVGGCLRIWLL